MRSALPVTQATQVHRELDAGQRTCKYTSHCQVPGKQPASQVSAFATAGAFCKAFNFAYTASLQAAPDWLLAFIWVKCPVSFPGLLCSFFCQGRPNAWTRSVTRPKIRKTSSSHLLWPWFKTNGIGEFTTHFRTYFSGAWDGFDPWPFLGFGRGGRGGWSRQEVHGARPGPVLCALPHGGAAAGGDQLGAETRLPQAKWVWLKIKELGLRRLQSLVPCTNLQFLVHVSAPQPSTKMLLLLMLVAPSHPVPF